MELLKKIYDWFIDIWQFVLLILSFALVIWIFIARPFQVSGRSMFPTFKDKEYVLTNLIVLRFYNPRRGDVIVFSAPPEPDKDFIKRIIGLPGDSVYLKDGFVYVNDKKIDESPYLDSSVRTYGTNFMKEGVKVTVPPNNYIVMGDNRPQSSDSREWGFLPKDKIIGESMFVYLPINSMRLVKNPYDTK